MLGRPELQFDLDTHGGDLDQTPSAMWVIACDGSRHGWPGLEVCGGSSTEAHQDIKATIWRIKILQQK